jgi:hypothetical protein
VAQNSIPRFLGYGFKVFRNPDAKVLDFGFAFSWRFWFFIQLFFALGFLGFSDFQKLSYPQLNDVEVSLLNSF